MFKSDSIRWIQRLNLSSFKCLLILCIVTWLGLLQLHFNYNSVKNIQYRPSTSAKTLPTEQQNAISRDRIPHLQQAKDTNPEKEQVEKQLRQEEETLNESSLDLPKNVSLSREEMLGQEVKSDEEEVQLQHKREPRVTVQGRARETKPHEQNSLFNQVFHVIERSPVDSLELKHHNGTMTREVEDRLGEKNDSVSGDSIERMIGSADNLTTSYFAGTKVVNLPYRKKRWERISGLLHTSSALLDSAPINRSVGVVGAKVNLVDFYYEKQLGAGAYRSLIYPRTVGGMYMTAGGMGCLLSHVELWRQASMLSRPLIIFEDDIELVPDFDERFKRVMDELPEDFGLFYFADMVNNEYTRGAATSYSPSLYKLSGEHWGTYAYMVSPAAARQLYAGVYPIRYQVDSYMIETCRQYHIGVYRSKINLVFTDNDPNRVSDVQQKRHEDSNKNLVPMNFHILSILPNVNVDKMVHRMRYKKNGQPRSKRKIMVWDTYELARALPSFTYIELRDGLFELRIFVLQLQILHLHGGLFLRPDFRSRFPIAKALRGLSGFVGFSKNADTSISFPIVGMTKHHLQSSEMIRIAERAIDKYPTNYVRASNFVFDKFQRVLDLFNKPGKVLLFPMDLLSSKSLT